MMIRTFGRVGLAVASLAALGGALAWIRPRAMPITRCPAPRRDRSPHDFWIHRGGLRQARRLPPVRQSPAYRRSQELHQPALLLCRMHAVDMDGHIIRVPGGITLPTMGRLASGSESVSTAAVVHTATGGGTALVGTTLAGTARFPVDPSSLTGLVTVLLRSSGYQPRS